ncbi:chitosanase [Clostridium folliculivorans]|uniref:Ricin B lectin domain-containing protein n=1 Tax=Clostridium folliculivorans TaxID=2886038 RepID=A0A9W5Y4N0_9CLOT|nr:chitosanase [Clostridium folliculivorans]GKU26382.1 hypothetical protein CFOLD11_32090 [Clostridium folliculivorans]GKU32063.1 hypothetical protein CFB3_41710 [Clostridium folliculivorans]
MEASKKWTSSKKTLATLALSFLFVLASVIPAKAYTFSSPSVEVMYKLTSIFENSTTTLKYNYCENIGDGRGYTFGFPGFCSGTYDGTMFLQEYQKLNPSNKLVKYIPAFQAIDAMPHPDGMQSSTAGLSGFPADFASCASDPAFQTAQHNLVDRLYWNPAQAAASEIGATLPITKGELYDAFINHGEDGARDIMNQTTQAVGGTPKTGVSEKTWLSKFLSIRYNILVSDPAWNGSEDRVKVYQTLLANNNVNLTAPLTVTCYGDNFTITTSTTNPTPVPTQWSSITSVYNGSYISADNYGNNPLVANRTTAGDWEKFQVIQNSDGTISLLSKINNKYVCADLNNGTKLVARSTTIDGWEKFKLVILSDGNVGLQAMANNKYVCADYNNGGVLYANRDSISGWETFSIKAAQ